MNAGLCLKRVWQVRRTDSFFCSLNKWAMRFLITMDKGLQYQQNLLGRTIAVVVVRAQSNRLADLLPYVEACRSTINSIQPGEILRVGE